MSIGRRQVIICKVVEQLPVQSKVHRCESLLSLVIFTPVSTFTIISVTSQEGKLINALLLSSNRTWGTWQAYSEKFGTLDLGVVNSSPRLGVEITKKYK